MNDINFKLKIVGTCANLIGTCLCCGHKYARAFYFKMQCAVIEAIAICIV